VRTVFLAEDHALVRAGLRSLLLGETGLTVVGEADDGLSAVSFLETHAADVVLLEAALPRLNGAEVIVHALKSNPAARFLAYSKFPDEALIVRVMQAGAAGFLSPRAGREELREAIDSVLAGRVHLSPDISSGLVRSLADGTSAKPVGLDRLTKRERQVLQLLAEGLPTRDAARELGISEKTVESHRQRVLQKLELSGIVELTHFAIRQGIARL